MLYPVVGVVPANFAEPCLASALSSWLPPFTPYGVTCIRTRTRQTNPVDGVAEFVANSEMPKRKFVEAKEPRERAEQRQKLGTLRELTVQPATRRRYDNATQQFFNFLQTNQLELPKQKALLDGLVCDYVEHLWSSGAGRALANDTLAGLQDLQPSIRGHLAGAWRLLKTWSVNEIPNRAPPLPEQVVLAMAGWGFFNGHYSFGVSLLIGFYTMLRSGELLHLNSSHILVAPQDRQVLISLGLTKGGKRQGAAESVIFGYDQAVAMVKRWKQIATSATPLVTSASKWRSLFSESLSALGLERFSFRPYSLRRGGATFWFGKHHNLDRILIQGRWQAQRTARIYLNEGLAALAQTQINFKHPSIASYLQIYSYTVKQCSFSTLEPRTPSVRRAGGRGRSSNQHQKSKKRGPKCAFRACLLVCCRCTFSFLLRCKCLGGVARTTCR